MYHPLTALVQRPVLNSHMTINLLSTHIITGPQPGTMVHNENRTFKECEPNNEYFSRYFQSKIHPIRVDFVQFVNILRWFPVLFKPNLAIIGLLDLVKTILRLIKLTFYNFFGNDYRYFRNREVNSTHPLKMWPSGGSIKLRFIEIYYL